MRLSTSGSEYLTATSVEESIEKKLESVLVELHTQLGVSLDNNNFVCTSEEYPELKAIVERDSEEFTITLSVTQDMGSEYLMMFKIECDGEIDSDTVYSVRKDVLVAINEVIELKNTDPEA